MLDEMPVCQELFHTNNGVAFADFIADGHKAASPRSARTNLRLSRLWHRSLALRHQPGQRRPGPGFPRPATNHHQALAPEPIHSRPDGPGGRLALHTGQASWLRRQELEQIQWRLGRLSNSPKFGWVRLAVRPRMFLH